MSVEKYTSPASNGWLLSLLLVALMVTSAIPSQIAPQENSLKQTPDSTYRTGGDEGLVDYDLYVSAANSTAGGDGFITTERPDTGGQEDASALDGVEFRSAEMISDLDIRGTSSSGNEIWIYYFLQFTGQEGSTADVTFSLESGSTAVASKTVSLDDPCQSGGILGSSCAYHGRQVLFDDIPSTGFTVGSGKQLILRIDAEASCEGGGGGLPGQSSSCDVRVAYDNVDNADGFTRIEVRANAMANSQVKIHHAGGAWLDEEVLEWAPNHRPEFREMQFSVDVRNAFGRYDIQQVKLVMISPGETSYPFEKIFDDNELRLDNEGLVGNYSWTYNQGIAAGEYGVQLEITDLQGHVVVFDHVGIEMLEYAIYLGLGDSQPEEVLIAPDKTSNVEFIVEHIGSGGNVIQVTMGLKQTMPSGFHTNFDQPEGYDVVAGGVPLRPILTIEAPDDDLTNAPDSITIIARAYADTDEDGTEEEIEVIETTIQVEVIDVFAPPRVNVYEDMDHQMEIADSVRPEAYDETLSHFVDSDQTGRFYVDILNSGFDQDLFRLKVKELPDQWDVDIFDNLTNNPLEKQSGAWLTPTIGSHSVETFILELYPPEDRDGEDIGIVEIEVTSDGDGSLSSIVRFTAHRTFGVYAEVIYDPSGLPDGYIENISAGEILDLTVRVTSQDGNGSTEVTPWQVKDPASLDMNLEPFDGKYGRWNWDISFASNGSSAPKVDLAPGDAEELNIAVQTQSGLPAGNHTMFLRVIEQVIGDEARYFDLPITFEIGRDEPDDLQITQKSELKAFSAGESRKMDFKVFNGNNIDLTILLGVDAPSGWNVGVQANPLLSVPAFSEANFTLLVVAPDDVRHGDEFTYTIEARPLDSEDYFEDEYTVRKHVTIEVESDGFDRIMGELVNPRLPTVIAGVLLIFLGGIWFSRRKQSVEVIEEWFDEDDLEMEKEEVDIPSPVSEDDDLELLDDDSEVDLDEDDDLDDDTELVEILE